MNNKSIGLLIVFFLFISLNAFCQPFGIEFGMSLDRVRQVSRTTPQNVETDWYRITPPNTHELFEEYYVQIHPTYGVYHIRAVSRTIVTNRHGAELIAQFDNIARMLERTYGNYLRRNRLNPESIFTDSQYFMYTLQNGDRELIAFWDREEGSRMPDNMADIVLSAEVTRLGLNGYLILAYYSINADRIEEEQASVF